ncbi:MAG: hypothetical protein LUE27_02015 [Clostridia bacterium]|nr:hypothetical protein [Clostridia bacterium]
MKKRPCYWFRSSALWTMVLPITITVMMFIIGLIVIAVSEDNEQVTDIGAIIFTLGLFCAFGCYGLYCLHQSYLKMTPEQKAAGEKVIEERRARRKASRKAWWEKKQEPLKAWKEKLHASKEAREASKPAMAEIREARKQVKSATRRLSKIAQADVRNANASVKAARETERATAKQARIKARAASKVARVEIRVAKAVLRAEAWKERQKDMAVKDEAKAKAMREKAASKELAKALGRETRMAAKTSEADAQKAVKDRMREPGRICRLPEKKKETVPQGLQSRG